MTDSEYLRYCSVKEPILHLSVTFIFSEHYIASSVRAFCLWPYYKKKGFDLIQVYLIGMLGLLQSHLGEYFSSSRVVGVGYFYFRNLSNFFSRLSKEGAPDNVHTQGVYLSILL